MDYAKRRQEIIEERERRRPHLVRDRWIRQLEADELGHLVELLGWPSDLEEILGRFAKVRGEAPRLRLETPHRTELLEVVPAIVRVQIPGDVWALSLEPLRMGPIRFDEGSFRATWADAFHVGHEDILIAGIDTTGFVATWEEIGGFHSTFGASVWKG